MALIIVWSDECCRAWREEKLASRIAIELEIVRYSVSLRYESISELWEMRGQVRFARLASERGNSPIIAKEGIMSAIIRSRHESILLPNKHQRYYHFGSDNNSCIGFVRFIHHYRWSVCQMIAFSIDLLFHLVPIPKKIDKILLVGFGKYCVISLLHNCVISVHLDSFDTCTNVARHLDRPGHCVFFLSFLLLLPTNCRSSYWKDDTEWPHLVSVCCTVDTVAHWPVFNDFSWVFVLWVVCLRSGA